MTEFQVSTGVLRHTAHELKDAVAVAREVHSHGMVLTLMAEAVGDPHGEHGLTHFLDTWSYGMGLIGDDAATLATFLGNAAQAYEQLEDQIAQGCR
jgi:hypothetical protein